MMAASHASPRWRWRETGRTGVSWLELLVAKDLVAGPGVAYAGRPDQDNATALKRFICEMRGAIKLSIHPADRSLLANEVTRPRLLFLGFCSAVKCLTAVPEWPHKFQQCVWLEILRMRPGLTQAHVEAFREAKLSLKAIAISFRQWPPWRERALAPAPGEELAEAADASPFGIECPGKCGTTIWCQAKPVPGMQ